MKSDHVPGMIVIWRKRRIRLRYCIFLCLLFVLFVVHISFRWYGWFVGRPGLTGTPPPAKFTISRAYPDRKTIFRENWLRMRKARVDWQAILAPCRDNTDWGSTKRGWEKENRSSGNESYIKYTSIRPAGELSRIFLQTRTASGREKTLGGDSWRVYFRGPSSVSATVFDHGNGTYEVMALLVEPGHYVVEAFLDYSLCDGLKDPPQNWFKVGNAQGKYQASGILGFLDEYLLEPLQGGKTISIQISPGKESRSKEINDFRNISGCSEFCSSLWDGHGTWVNGKWRPYAPEERSKTKRQVAIPFRERRGTLWIYGDSLALRLKGSLSGKLICTDVFALCRYSYNWMYPIPFENELEGKRRNDDLDFRPHLVLESIRDVLRADDMKSEESLLVLNLGLHFPIGLNFTTYQYLIRDVIRVLKDREHELGSKARVIWKTSTAIHKDKVEEPRNLTHWRFFTDQRVRLFDAFAMSAMCKAGIEILDVYQLTASYPNEVQDVVHYDNGVFHDAEMEIQRYAESRAAYKPLRICVG